MRRMTLFLMLLLAPICAAMAQDDPKFDVFGGYSFMSTDLLETPEVVPGMRDGFQGWNVAVTCYASHNVGFTADFSGHYGSQNIPFFGKTTARLYSFAFGPKLVHHADNFEMFVHGLFGFNNAQLKAPPEEEINNSRTISDNDFAMVLGGGLDYVMKKQFAFRVVQVDYMMGQLFGSIENHIRVSTGITYRLKK
jgi:hypothetical protein